jgi:ABC-type dipeptide/oligopeptide/nickel transport system ATPase component
MRDTIDMAREAGFGGNPIMAIGQENLERFETLVRADERNKQGEAFQQILSSVKACAIADEREACAQVVEEYPHWLGMTAKAEIANAIRNRRNT